MNHDTDHDPTSEDAGFTRPPFLYEIRVQGRLSHAQWRDWFDDLTVATAAGVSTLSGSVPDHAALYGLLGRLRGLAIPLISVKVLDADAQRKLAQQSRRYDLLLNGILGAIYLLLLGGLAALTVFLAPIINTALALALLFALLGGLAHAFWLWSGGAGWRWLSYGAWVAAGGAFTIFIPLSGWLPPALGIAVLLFILAAGLIYLLALLRRHADALRTRLSLRWQPASKGGSPACSLPGWRCASAAAARPSSWPRSRATTASSWTICWPRCWRARRPTCAISCAALRSSTA